MINNHYSKPSPVPPATAIESDAEASPFPSSSQPISDLVPTLIEWNIVVIPASNYYQINVTQNESIQTQIIKSTNQCKETANVSVLPDVPADIWVGGYTLDPSTHPELEPNDIYTTTYTVYVDDPVTLHYENKTFGRRKDKEDGGDFIYEAKVLEGVCSLPA